jgi:precorrin-2 dehydrogenase / sirohydrochlorin ferrochelatase
MVPLFLQLTGRQCVVVGGGSVGRRKAKTLCDAGARVRLVCLEDRPQDFTVLDAEWITAPYCPEHLKDAALVFAAATPEVNRQVVAAAKARGIWVNSASEPESGDFYVPSVVRQGDFVLAIGTRGAAPALAREVRRKLEGEFDATFGHWVALLAEFRPIVQERCADPERRRMIFERMCQWHWLERLRQDGIEETRAAMAADVQALAATSSDPL